MKKLSFYQTYTLIGLIGFVIVVPCLYYSLGAERSYSILIDLFPYGTGYVAGLLYQMQLDLENISLYPLSIKEKILPRIKRILSAASDVYKRQVIYYIHYFLTFFIDLVLLT